MTLLVGSRGCSIIDISSKSVIGWKRGVMPDLLKSWSKDREADSEVLARPNGDAVASLEWLQEQNDACCLAPNSFESERSMNREELRPIY